MTMHCCLQKEGARVRGLCAVVGGKAGLVGLEAEQAVLMF